MRVHIPRWSREPLRPSLAADSSPSFHRWESILRRGHLGQRCGVRGTRALPPPFHTYCGHPLRPFPQRAPRSWQVPRHRYLYSTVEKMGYT